MLRRISALTSAAIICGGVTFGFAEPVAAATIAVTTTSDVISATDGLMSLREAVLRANSLAGADTIQLPAGAYVVALHGDAEDAGRTGDFDISGTLSIVGAAGAANTFIDGGGSDRTLDLKANGRLTLIGVTVKKGFTEDDGGGLRAAAGAIVNIGGTGTAANQPAAFRENLTEGNGGAIASTNAQINVRRGSEISNNVAYVNGAGIASVGGSIALTGASMIENESRDAAGAIHATGTAITVNSSVLSRNKAEGDGGAISSANGSVALGAMSILEWNYSLGSGGAVHNVNGPVTVSGGSIVEFERRSNGRWRRRCPQRRRHRDRHRGEHPALEFLYRTWWCNLQCRRRHARHHRPHRKFPCTSQ